MPTRWPPFALAAAFVVADQLSKAWVVAEVPFGTRVASWAGFLHLTHTRNTGAAFGLLRDGMLEWGALRISGVQLLGLVSLVVAVALAVWLARSRSLNLPTRLALGAIMGGAIGNGIDRWRLGYVTDFLHAQVGWFDFPVFNVADIGISVGATALLLASLLGGRHPPHETDRDGASGEPGAMAAGSGPPEAHPAAPAEPDGVAVATEVAGGAPEPGEPEPGAPDPGARDPGPPGPGVPEGGGAVDAAVSDAPTRSANDR
jgi:signal peptidase II